MYITSAEVHISLPKVVIMTRWRYSHMAYGLMSGARSPRYTLYFFFRSIIEGVKFGK